MDSINFYLPDFYYNFKLNMLFIDLLNKQPHVFFPGVKIKAVYGAFPPAIWNGGRCMPGYTSYENMVNTLKAYNDEGVSVRYTYTNCLLEEKHLSDHFCNLTMQAADNCMNEVIINSELLEAYIRENYPSFNLISSTTKRLLTEEDIATELQKDYSLIVLDYAFNNRDKILFSEDHVVCQNAGRFELLLNAYCQDDCPIRKRHYKQLSAQQLGFNEQTPDFEACCHIGEDFYSVMEKRKGFIHVEDLYTKYYDAGYRHFKIEGRTMKMVDILESYIYYMIQPQYRDKIRLQALRQLL